MNDTAQIHLVFVVGIEEAVLHGDGGDDHGLDVPVDQQVADLAVGMDTACVTAGLQIAVVDGICQICGEIVLFAKYAGTDVKVADETLKILSVSDVLGVIE